MPQRECPKCHNRESWDIQNQKCGSCGYSSTDAIRHPVKPYQMGKIKKHIEGTDEKGSGNWVFFAERKDELEPILKQTMADGSTLNPTTIVVTFEKPVGYNQENPENITNWIKAVKTNKAEGLHIFPLDPKKAPQGPYICIHCGHRHKGKCPLQCEKCGKNPWL